jgi:hypothetical protein
VLLHFSVSMCQACMAVFFVLGSDSGTQLCDLGVYALWWEQELSPVTSRKNSHSSGPLGLASPPHSPHPWKTTGYVTSSDFAPDPFPFSLSS